MQDIFGRRQWFIGNNGLRQSAAWTMLQHRSHTRIQHRPTVIRRRTPDENKPCRPHRRRRQLGVTVAQRRHQSMILPRRLLPRLSRADRAPR